jgi:hypothetical protein
MTANSRPWLARDDWREGVVHSGGSTFTFERVPFLLGDKLAGTLRVRHAALGDDSSVMLGCFPGTHDSDSALHWRAIHPIPPELVRGEPDVTEIAVEFTLPADRSPTRLGLISFTWELSVLKGFTNGVRIVVFQVPVFGREAKAFAQDTTVARDRKRQLRKALSVFDE